MRMFEKITALLLILSIVGWFMRWPFTSLVMLLSATTLSCLYYLFLRRLCRIEGPSRFSMGPVHLILLRLGLGAAVIAFLFWFQAWPMGKQLGLAALLLLGAGLAICHRLFKGKPAWFAVWTRGAVWGGLMLLLQAIPQYIHISLKYADTPDYRDAYIHFLENREDPLAYDAWQQSHCKHFPLQCGYVE